jgi:hypothetical protein
MPSIRLCPVGASEKGKKMSRVVPHLFFSHGDILKSTQSHSLTGIGLKDDQSGKNEMTWRKQSSNCVGNRKVGKKAKNKMIIISKRGEGSVGGPR